MSLVRFCTINHSSSPPFSLSSSSSHDLQSGIRKCTDQLSHRCHQYGDPSHETKTLTQRQAEEARDAVLYNDRLATLLYILFCVCVLCLTFSSSSHLFAFPLSSHRRRPPVSNCSRPINAINHPGTLCVSVIPVSLLACSFLFCFFFLYYFFVCSYRLFITFIPSLLLQSHCPSSLTIPHFIRLSAIIDGYRSGLSRLPLAFLYFVFPLSGMIGFIYATLTISSANYLWRCVFTQPSNPLLPTMHDAVLSVRRSEHSPSLDVVHAKKGVDQTEGSIGGREDRRVSGSESVS